MNKQTNKTGPAQRRRKEKAEWRELNTITNTMQKPAFDGDQLAALWPQIAFADGQARSFNRLDIWRCELDTMYRRCETYPQYTKITVRLSELPNRAWITNNWIADRADELLQQATPEQLVEALMHEQQHREGWWTVSGDILTHAAPEQLTGTVIEQLTGPAIEMLGKNAGRFAEVNGTAWEADDAGWARQVGHVENHIRQHLLDGDDNAWDMFLGVADADTTIGDVVQIINAVEQDDSQNRHKA